MIQVSTPQQAAATRHRGRLFNGCEYFRSDFFGSARISGRERPQGFYVEQAPGSTVPPHFHEVDQFQVVVRGRGVLGRHAISPVSVHYTNAYTGYGPIHADPGGLDYFTLRARHDSGARFFPEGRAQQKKGPRRHLLAEAPSAPEAMKSQAPPRVTTLIPPQGDDPGAWHLSLEPRTPMHRKELESLTGTAHGGCYVVITAGGLLHPEAERHGEADTLPAMSCVFIPPGLAPCSLEAGPDGVQALLLRFPLPFNPL